METKNGKIKKFDEMTLAKTFKIMFKDMKSGRTIYLAFSRMNFYVLIYIIAMSVIANIVLVDLLIQAPTVVARSDTFVYIVQLSLSVAAIVSALWLFFKGINIITDK